MPHLFRVWDACRKKKSTFVLEDSVDIVNNLLHKSSEKFGVKGVSIVLEKCGTVIDDAESLIMLNKEVFIVLSENQIWQKESSETDIKDSLSNDGETVVPENVNSGDDSMETTALNSSCEQLTSDLPEPTTSSNKANNSESLPQKPNQNWDTFRIPWDKFDSNSLTALQNKIKTKNVIKKVTSKIIDELRCINQRIPVVVLKNVAMELRDTYLDIFEDRNDDGTRLGNGIVGVMSNLFNRNSYLNRRNMSDGLSKELNIPVKKLKSLQNIKVGCINWQPEFYAAGVTTESVEMDKDLLFTFQGLDTSDAEMVQAIAFKNSFPLQRLFINNPNEKISAPLIQQVWPCLLKKTYLLKHFSLLTDKDVPDIIKRFNDDIPKLLAYGKMNNYIDVDETLSEDKKHVLAIQTIFKHFKEEYNYLFHNTIVCINLLIFFL